MNKIIELIQDGYGFSVDSPVAAVQEFNQAARAGAYSGTLGNMLRNLLNIDCQELENEDYTRIQVVYVIQLAVEAHLVGKEFDPNDLYVEATKRARELIKDMPWVFAKKLDPNDTQKTAKKGAKAVRSYEVYCDLITKNTTRKDIIAAFQSEDVMAPCAPHTKSGATTYYYNMKKKYEAEHG